MSGLPRRSLLLGSAAGVAATATASARPAVAEPGSLAASLLVLPPELDGRIFPEGTADLSLAVPSYASGAVDGGVLRSVTSLQIPWSYTQTTKPTDTAIGTAVLVDWQATLNDANLFGPNAQTGFFGPRGVFQLEGEVRYQRDMGQFNITPIAYASQLAITNADGGDRTITPGWGFMNNAWFMAKDSRKLTLRFNDTARGMGGFIDNQVYTVAEGTSGSIDGSTHGYESLSFVSRNFVTTDVHLAGVVGFDMADINHPIEGGSEPGPAAGQVDYTIGLRVEHLSRGGTFGIGVENASRTVRPPQTATVTGAGDTVRTDATWVIVENTTPGPLTLTSTPSLPAGREGQVLTLVNGGAQPVTLQGEAALSGSLLASTHTLLPGDLVDLVFHDDRWQVRGDAVGWHRTASRPGTSAWALPAPEAGVTTYQTTHPSGGATGIDIMTPAGETAPSANVRLFQAGDVAARNVVAAGVIGFSDGVDAAGGSYIARTGPGVVTVGDFGGTLHTIEAATVHGGQRRDINATSSTGYAVVAADRRRTVTRTNASASTMTWPSDATAPELPVGTEIPVCNLGTGAITHQGGSGASVVTDGTQPRGARWVGVKVAADTWCVG